MRSKFDNVLKIVDGGAVRAKGGFEWDDDETEALVSVSISQPGEKVAGMATTTKEFKKPAKGWTIDIKPGYHKKFKPGRADAIGIVCAMGDKVNVFFWGHKVTLERD